MEPEIIVNYPRAWEVEYRQHGCVGQWINDFRDMYEKSANSARFPCLSANPNTLDLFAQYALMYVLRAREGVHSLTWYSLAQTSLKIKNLSRREAHHRVMQRCMGEEAFRLLQRAVVGAGFRDFTAEPDLFCWKPDSGDWFFAEAKGKDTLGKRQVEWFRICRETLPTVDIRVYKLRPAD